MKFVGRAAKFRDMMAIPYNDDVHQASYQAMHVPFRQTDHFKNLLSVFFALEQICLRWHAHDGYPYHIVGRIIHTWSCMNMYLMYVA